MALDEEVPVLEQITGLTLDPLLAARGLLRSLGGGTTPWQLGSAGRQGLAQLGHGGEDRLVQVAKDVERAELMRHVTEDRGNRLRVQLRAVGRDPLHSQPARLQGRVEAAKERLDVALGRIVVKDLVGEPLEGAVINDREDGEWAVIQLVGSDEAREVRQRP